MTKFTLCLFAASALAGADAMAAEIKAAAQVSPKVIATARMADGKTLPSRSLRKPAKKQNPLNRKARVRYAEAPEDGVLYSCSFAFLTEGSETEPAELELDDWDNIPEELIGEENYGFGGQGLMQAGGALFVPYEYNEDPDDEWGWWMEGMLWTPDLYEAMEVTVDMDVKITDNCDIDTDELWVYASDYSWNFDYDSAEIDKEWKHVTLSINAKDFVPEEEDDSYYFTIFADGGADMVIKNVVISGKKAELQVPVAQEYTEFTGTSFTANWTEVEGATGYYLTVYTFDPNTKKNTSTFLEAQFTEDNFYTVEGLNPGDFYSYEVQATNGSYVTSPSNLVLVVELAAPTGVTLKADGDKTALIADWDATPGANYYVVTAKAIQEVGAGETVVLADADFSGIESTGTVATPEESDYWYESKPELPGWQFNLGCSAPGAFGFWDNAYYTSVTGLLASLSSMDYDLANVKDGKVDVTIEAASPGNGLLAGLLTLNDSNNYEVASAWGTSENVPEDYETYTFSLTGATANTEFLIVTRTENNEDGALLIRRLQISAEAAAEGTIGSPVGMVQTAATTGEFATEVKDFITYSVIVTPYLVDDKGYILAKGAASEPATFKGGVDSIAEIESANEETATYYDLQGMIITAPAPGTPAIKVTGTKAVKVIL